jgi:putative MFS transporter
LPARRFLLACLLYFLQPWATIPFFLLNGPVLLRNGFGSSDPFLYLGCAAAGPVIGTSIGALFIDRIRWPLAPALCCGVMLLATALFFAAQAPAALLMAIVSFQIGSALYLPTMMIFVAEMFPTASRATATSAAWMLNCVAAAIILIRGGAPNG